MAILITVHFYVNQSRISHDCLQDIFPESVTIHFLSLNDVILISVTSETLPIDISSIAYLKLNLYCSVIV